MNKGLYASAIFLGLVAGSVFAEQPSYSYLEAGYTNVSFTDSDTDGPGYVVRGSFDFGNSFYVTGSNSQVSFDVGFGDLEYRTLKLGVGAKTAMTDNTSLFIEANYLNVSFDLLDFSDSDNGYTLSTGVRSMLTENTELYANITHENVQDSNTVLGFGVRQNLTEQLGLFAEYTRDDSETNSYSVGASFKF